MKRKQTLRTPKLRQNLQLSFLYSYYPSATANIRPFLYSSAPLRHRLTFYGPGLGLPPSGKGPSFGFATGDKTIRHS